MKYVDASAELTAAALSRQAADLGMDVSDARILTHRKHRDQEKRDHPPEAKQKRDFAILIRDRAYEGVENGELDLGDKNQVPGINAGLKAQAILDSREKAKSKQATAELAYAIIQMLRDGGVSTTVDAPALDDGMTIEGDFEDISDDG